MGKPESRIFSQPDFAPARSVLFPRMMACGSILGALLITGIVPAAADAIDGNWCHPDGRRLSIRGPEIITPGGAKLEGQYGRHDFSYTAPGSEPAAGQTIFMLLVNENTVRLKAGSAPSSSDPVEVWTRCGPSIS